MSENGERASRSGRRWMEEEDRVLSRDWGKRPPGLVAVQLGRTEMACRMRAMRLRREAERALLVRPSFWRRFVRWLRGD